MPSIEDDNSVGCEDKAYAQHEQCDGTITTTPKTTNEETLNFHDPEILNGPSTSSLASIKDHLLSNNVNSHDDSSSFQHDESDLFFDLNDALSNLRLSDRRRSLVADKEEQGQLHSLQTHHSSNFEPGLIDDIRKDASQSTPNQERSLASDSVDHQLTKTNVDSPCLIDFDATVNLKSAEDSAFQLEDSNCTRESPIRSNGQAQETTCTSSTPCNTTKEAFADDPLFTHFSQDGDHLAVEEGQFQSPIIIEPDFLAGGEYNVNVSNRTSTDSYLTAVSESANMSTDERPLSGKGGYTFDPDQALLDDEEQATKAFGGRLSVGSTTTPCVSRNKTFTRKTPQNSAKQSSANSSASSTTEINANQQQTVEVSGTKEQHQLPLVSEDTANSNVKSIAPAVTETFATVTIISEKNAPKVAQPHDASKKDSTNPRNFTPQQTAIVAPMINKHATDTTTSFASETKVKVTPTLVTKRASQPSTCLNRGSGDGEFVTANPDMFSDPSALDYLQKAGSGINSSSDSDIYRQSLYVKFDPLVSSVGNVSVSKKMDAGASATSHVSAAARASPAKKGHHQQVPMTSSTASWMDVAMTSEEMAAFEDDDLLLMKTPSPHVRPGGYETGRGSPLCPPTVVLKKKTMSSSSHVDELDNVLMSGSMSRQADEFNSFPFECDYFELVNDSEQIDPVVQRVKMQCQAYIVSKEKEWISKFREERERSDKIASASAKEIKELKLAMREYETTIEELIHQLDMFKSDKDKYGDYDALIKEKEHAVEDLQTVENALSELHRRYESLRSNVEEYKKNEEKWRDCVSEIQKKLQTSEEMFRKLKEHAEEKLECANAEIIRLRKSKESDTLALKALCKKRELQVSSLERTLEQKQKEIHELSKICDELIQKVDYPQHTISANVK